MKANKPAVNLKAFKLERSSGVCLVEQGVVMISLVNTVKSASCVIVSSQSQALNDSVSGPRMAHSSGFYKTEQIQATDHLSQEGTYLQTLAAG